MTEDKGELSADPNPSGNARPKLLAWLKAGLEGKVVGTGPTLARYSRDFGAIGRKRPRLIVFPKSEKDIRFVLATARKFKVAVTIRGSGCSANGQSLSDGGILIVTVRGRLVTPLEREDNCFEISAHNRWGAVENWLNAKGRSIPVLADNLSLTVGGTLAVGGYGIDSIIQGSQISHIKRLKLLTPDGESCWVSLDKQPDLFRFSLAGQGRLGVIQKVVIATEPYSRYSVLFQHSHRNLTDLAESMAWLDHVSANCPPLFKAYQARGKTVSVYGYYADSLVKARAYKASPLDSARDNSMRRILPAYRRLRSLSVKLWVGHYGHRKRMWSDFLVDYQGLKELTAVIESLNSTGGFGSCLKSVYVLANRTTGRGSQLPFDAGEVGKGPMSFGVGLYCMVPTNDEAALVSVNRSMQLCLETALCSGGRPYLYGWHGLDDGQLQKIQGEEFNQFQNLRQQMDPEMLFQRGKVLTRQQAEEIVGY